MSVKSIATMSACGLALLLSGRAFGQENTPAKGQGTPHAEALRWRVSCQAFSFKKSTFYEAIDKVKAIGLHYIEAYPNQNLSIEKPDVKIDHNLPEDLRKEVLARLRTAGVKLVNYGVVGLPNDEAEACKVFDFAEAMGIETIVSEPTEETIPLLDRLTEEYGINVAIHNHAKPKHYWNPDILLAAVNGHSKRIGACADTGHWMRSGVHPLEAIKKLQGRLICFHFRDTNEFGTLEAHDVPWGTGKAEVKALLTELKRQGFKGVFSAEYDFHWENNLPEIAQSAATFDQFAAELAAPTTSGVR